MKVKLFIALLGIVVVTSVGVYGAVVHSDQSTKILAEHKAVAAGYTTLFCLNKSDIVTLAGMLRDEGDAKAQSLGEQLAQSDSCGYLSGVGFWQDGVRGTSVCARGGGSCVGVQPAFVENTEVQNGAILEGFVVTTAGRQDPLSDERTVWALAE